MKEFVEKLVKRLKELKTGYECYPRNPEQIYLDNKIDKVIEIVNELAEEYVPDINVGKWIPCKEKMPKEAEDVILTFRNSAGTFVEMATCIRGKFYYISDADGNYYEEEVKEPIAWLPLPDPYKPGQQKEIPTSHYEERFNRVM